MIDLSVPLEDKPCLHQVTSAATLLKRLDRVGKPRNTILLRVGILLGHGDLVQHLGDIVAGDLGRELADYDLAKNGLAAL